MMKYVIGLLVLVMVPLARAEEKPTRWICDVQNPNQAGPQPNQVEISLLEPTATEILYALQENGISISATTKLITAESISTWNIVRSKCQVKSGYTENETMDSYEFVFSCGVVRGVLSLDFKNRTGIYSQEMARRDRVTRTLLLDNCREQ